MHDENDIQIIVRSRPGRGKTIVTREIVQLLHEIGFTVDLDESITIEGDLFRRTEDEHDQAISAVSRRSKIVIKNEGVNRLAYA